MIISLGDRLCHSISMILVREKIIAACVYNNLYSKSTFILFFGGIVDIEWAATNYWVRANLQPM
jgi:hypothetical protein